MIRYWHPQDDLPVSGAAPSLTDDGGDGWWAGVQQCFTSVAIALALTASTGIAAQAQKIITQPQDELVFQQVSDDDSSWQPPRAYILAAVYPDPEDFARGDEVPSQQVFDDDSSWSPPRAYIIPPVYTQPWSFQADEIVSQPVTFIDDGYWWNPFQPAPLPVYQMQPYFFDTQDVVGTVQNYIATFGVHNYPTQDIGAGVEF